jgi:hypothetical protein
MGREDLSLASDDARRLASLAAMLFVFVVMNSSILNCMSKLGRTNSILGAIRSLVGIVKEPHVRASSC